MTPTLTPEDKAREQIDAMLSTSGWVVQDRAEMNVWAGQGVAVREFPLVTGEADYLLFVGGKAVGALEAKKVGHTLKGVEVQSGKYAQGLPHGLNPPVTPLPFLYESTGVETQFTNLLDPYPRSRPVFAVHRPETLAEWLAADTLDKWVKTLHEDGTGLFTAADDSRPSSFRSRLQTLPPLEQPREGSGWRLFPNQMQAITNLEASFKKDRPRALIQMATGSGKTLMAITAVYRLIKFGGARSVLFLVDRTNLGEQAEKEFQNYRTPDDNRKFTELYKVQRLTSNSIGASSKVVITTVQRFYSMLRGEAEYDPALEEGSVFEAPDPLMKEPLPVVYNPSYPPETFDVVFVDECHRSIYTLWRQVLEYFDATLVGLTATPAKHTFGFFNQNLVMEYPHEQAVADGVNVDFEVYRIRTRITEQGSTIEACPEPVLGLRNRRTHQTRWESPDESVTYTGGDLDRSVVAPDQIRTVVRTFRDRVFTDLFPGRTEVPKTLVFCKDDAHAEDVVGIIREEFGRGNAFAQKITYKTTGTKPADLIQAFRNSFDPRVAVTVDMVATGTDIRPIEIVMFLRPVKSRVLFEQMKGRGVRIIDPTELKAVSPDATAKTHFVIVDCVGVVESGLSDTQPLEKKKSVPLKNLLEHVAMGGTDPDVLSSLASRLARLDKELGPEQDQKIQAASGGMSLPDICHGILDALDPDRQVAEAQVSLGLGSDQEPTDAQVVQAAETLCKAAVAPLATKPALRQTILDLKAQVEQVIDTVSKDEVLFAGASPEAKDKARALVASFESFLAEHHDEIDALQFFYSQPYAKRLRFGDVKALAEVIQAPPRSWTPDLLWRAYEVLEKDRVRGASGRRLLTDIVSLVRFALHRDDALVPFGEQVRARFENWLAQQETHGRRFTPEQVRWLTMIRDHVAANVEIEVEDFDLNPFAQEGGLGRAAQVFGKELGAVLKELNEVLAA
jgi:type I restriction enzyme R subunit